MLKFLNPSSAYLMVIDPQEKLMAVVSEAERVVKNISLLLRLADTFGLPVIPTTQYVKGLGPYVEPLKELVSPYKLYDKVEFSAFKNETIKAACKELKRRTLILCGVETHICVYQTALSALMEGQEVVVAADATSSRSLENMKYGLERMREIGAQVFSTEMIIYEMLEKAGTEAFKALLPYLK